jgi:hypothetical protein
VTALVDLPVRYTLPVTSVQPGMSTKDSRPVLHVSQPYTTGGDRLWVTVQVGEPRRPGLGHSDADRRPESWHVLADIPITLGVFDDTDVDGSGRQDAGPLPTPDGRTIVIRRDGVRVALSYTGVAALGQSTWVWRVFNHTRSFASGVTWAVTLDQARAKALTEATGSAPSQRAARALEAISAAALPRRPDELEPDEVFLWQSRWWTLRRHLSADDQGDLASHLLLAVSDLGMEQRVRLHQRTNAPLGEIHVRQ